MKKKIKLSVKKLLVVFLVLFLAMNPLFFAKMTKGANFAEATIQLDRMTPSFVDNQILVIVKPTTTAVEASVKISFAAGFAVDATPANVTTATAGIPATYQGEALMAWPGIGATASVIGGNDATFASGDLTVGTLYGFYITAGVDNPGAVGQYVNTITTQTNVPGNIDKTRVATRIIADDQIIITAKVPPTFNFVLDGNTDDFTTDLDPGSVVSTAGRTVTIATNANNGWITWLKSANTSLDSATTLETIETIGAVDNTPSVLTTGTDGYVLDVDLTTDSAVGGGTVAIDPEYNGAIGGGGTLPAVFEEIATSDGTTDGDVLTLYGRATISAVKGAAEDYTDTWTVIGAGNF